MSKKLSNSDSWSCECFPSTTITPTDDRQLTAAMKLQALARGHRTRKQTDQLKQREEAATKLQAVTQGYQTRKKQRAQARAATKLQAVTQGYQTRKKQRAQARAATKLQALAQGFQTRKKQHAQARAATKLQAVARGRRTRKNQTDNQITMDGGVRTYGHQTHKKNIHKKIKRSSHHKAKKYKK